MNYEVCSVCIMAEVRHAELQAESAWYRSGRTATALGPSVGNLVAAGWRRVRERFGVPGAGDPGSTGRGKSHPVLAEARPAS